MEDVVCVNETIDLKKRKETFLEVKKDINEETADLLAKRCLNCKNPMCVKGCPIHINIPKFIECIKNSDYNGAYEVISEKSVMPEVCGRVCPQELTCEAKCIRGIKDCPVSIGILERFASKYKHKIQKSPSNGIKVLIIGSGPAGLSCAYNLAKKGFDTTIYEASHEFGGVLTYGIPEFRLPKSIVDDIINKLKELDVKLVSNILVGKTITLEELQEEYKYIFIGTGAGVPKNLDIKGVMLKNVMSANELLTRVNLMKSPLSDTPLNKSKKSIIIGGGNVANDAARVMSRLGSDVTVCYRKDESNLKMRKEEYNHAKEEGIKFLFDMVPTEIIGDDNSCVKGIKFSNNKYLECDTLIIAIGTNQNHLILENTDIKINNIETTNPNIFAGGDIIRGNATVIDALSDGIIAAEKICNLENI